MGKLAITAIGLAGWWGLWWLVSLYEMSVEADREVTSVPTEVMASRAAEVKLPQEAINAAVMIAPIPLPPVPLQNGHIRTADPTEIETQTNQPTSVAAVNAKQSGSVISNSAPTSARSRAQQVYQQMVNDASLSIELAFPQSLQKRQALLHYFYQCAGVQLGLLREQQVILVSPKRHGPLSQWMRMANGYMSAQEKKWLAEAQGQGRPVRLFPMEIDSILAGFISTNLENEQLSHFTARYHLRRGQLYLTDIHLNDRQLPTLLNLTIESC